MRRARSAILLLLLGLFSTILIAWSAALFIHVPGDVYAPPIKASVRSGWRMLTPEESRITGLNGRAISATRYDRFASTYISIDVLTVAGTGDRANMERTREVPETLAAPFARTIVFPWTCANRPWPPNDDYAYFALRGWPFRALALEYEQVYPPGNTMTGETVVHHGIRVKFNDPTSVWYAPPPSPTALPYLPIWPGLILDTLFFAALWSVLLFGIPAAIRARRRQQNLCAKCRYDLGATPADRPCPECGTARSVAITSSPAPDPSR